MVLSLRLTLGCPIDKLLSIRMPQAASRKRLGPAPGGASFNDEPRQLFEVPQGPAGGAGAPGDEAVAVPTTNCWNGTGASRSVATKQRIREAPVHGDGSELGRAGAVLLGLPDFEVLASAEVGGEIELVVQTAVRSVGCPRCGVVAAGKGRRATLVRDLPARLRPVVVIWHKRLWTCPDSVCPHGSWTEQHPQIRARAALTERARWWAFEQVGRASGRWRRWRPSSGWAGRR